MCVISSVNEVKDHSKIKKTCLLTEATLQPGRTGRGGGGGLTNPFIFKQTIETERTEQISRFLVYSVPSSSVIKENKLSGVSKFN